MRKIKVKRDRVRRDKVNNDAQKENTNVSKKSYRWLKITAIIVVVIILACLFLQIGTWSTHKEEGNFVPDYEKIDISALLDKAELGGEDYDLLYRQTGLTEIGIERELKRGEAGKRKILEIQAAFFTPREVVRKYVAAWMCIDVVRGAAPNVTLETGDIIVSASTHISSLRIGHTGLVVDGEKGEVLQATAYGENTLIGDVTDFTSRINFLVLRPKASAETKQKVAAYAKENLVGIPYDAFAVVITHKNTIPRTQCAHIVWYAYKQFGVDLVSENKLMILPYDLANSDGVEVVQSFGFDPEKKWNKLIF